jgi:hypothetical protein
MAWAVSESASFTRLDSPKSSSLTAPVAALLVLRSEFFPAFILVTAPVGSFQPRCLRYFFRHSGPTIFRGPPIPVVVPSPLFSTPILVHQRHNERSGQFSGSLSPIIFPWCFRPKSFLNASFRCRFFFSFSSSFFVFARRPEGVGQKQHPLLLTPPQSRQWDRR